MPYRSERKENEDGTIDFVIVSEDGARVCDVPEGYYDSDVWAQKEAAELMARLLNEHEQDVTAMIRSMTS